MSADALDQGASLGSTTRTLVSNLVGAGLLSLPYTMLRAGLVPGIIAMIAVTLLNSFSAMLIAHCCDLAGKYTYKEVAVAALGKRAAWGVAATLVLYTLGSCVAFSVLVGDFIPDLIDFAIDNACGAAGCSSGQQTARDIFGRSEVAIVLAGSMFLYPLALKRNLDSLKFTSGLSFICIIYTFLMLISLTIKGPRADPAQLNVKGSFGGLAIALPVLLVALTAHYNIPKLHGELGSRRSLRRMGMVVLSSFAFVFVVYMGSALAGYILKGAATKSDILLSFDEGDGPIVVARVALSVVVISCYPLAFNSLRIALVSLLPAGWAERIKAPHFSLASYEADELEEDASAGAGGVVVAVPGSGSVGGYARVPQADSTAGLGGAAATPSAAAAAGVGDSRSLGRGVSSAELTAVNGSGSGSGSASPTAAAAGGSGLLVRRSTGSGAGAASAAAASVTVAAVSGAGAAAAASPAALPIPLRRPRAANQRVTLCRVGDRFACSLPTCRALCINLRADWPHALITKITVLISLTIAILVPNIETVLGYKGALGGSLVVVVFPAWMYFGLTQRRLAAAAPGAATGSVSGAAAVADWAVRKDDSSPADDKAALLLADSAAAVEGGVLAPAASGVPLAELRWEWRDLLHTRHGLLAAAGSVLGAALMVSGTLAASHVI